MRLPHIADIKLNSLDDGPGIRSVVFFKGCPLRCVWCQNPEMIAPHPEIQRAETSCQRCGACHEACPSGIARPSGDPEDREPCTQCGACVEACAPGARRRVGERRELDELVDVLLADAPFYRRSGGGVTLSGGEPTLFLPFVSALAQKLHGAGISVLLETCGYFSWDAFAERLAPFIDQVYIDYKIANLEDHRRFTGRSNRRIRANLAHLAHCAHVETLPRVPLVPGVTATADNLRAIARELGSYGFSRVALLPYNPLWVPKRRGLSMDAPFADDEWMSAEDVATARGIVSEHGLEVL